MFRSVTSGSQHRPGLVGSTICGEAQVVGVVVGVFVVVVVVMVVVVMVMVVVAVVL